MSEAMEIHFIRKAKHHNGPEWPKEGIVEKVLVLKVHMGLFFDSYANYHADNKNIVHSNLSNDKITC